ncbi:MAG: hypothetical protein KKD73_12260 [Proteobacteria bacterium]|nr:hypothetical protein [Pseudomonadota bacterium]MBU1639991.1 hypothetical protein [Pseudomonadota bacterium]
MSHSKYHLWSRVIVFCLLLMALASPAFAANKTQTVVILTNHNTEAHQQLSSFFEAHLRNRYPALEIAQYLLDDDTKKNNTTFREIRQRNPAIILALGSSAIRSGLEAFPGTPLVASMVINEESFTLSNQATGVLLKLPAQTHFLWLKRFLPSVKNVGVLYDPNENSTWIQEAEEAARLNGLKLVAITVESPQNLPQALKAISRSTEVLIGIPDTTVYSRNTVKMVLLSTFRNRIPFVGLSQSWVKAGALYSLDWDYGDIGTQCGAIAGQILAGTPPSTIPPQIPKSQPRFSINMKTARHMNLDIDSSLVAGASSIYE